MLWLRHAPAMPIIASDRSRFPVHICKSGAGGARTHDPGIMRSPGLTLMRIRQTAAIPGEPFVLYSPNPRL